MCRHCYGQRAKKFFASVKLIGSDAAGVTISIAIYRVSFDVVFFTAFFARTFGGSGTAAINPPSKISLRRLRVNPPRHQRRGGMYINNRLVEPTFT